MADSRAEVRREIEAMRASIGSQLGEMEQLVGHKVQALKDSIDWRYQVRAHPWTAPALAAVAGYLTRSILGKLFSGSRKPSASRRRRRDDDGDGSFFSTLLGSIAGIVLRDVARRAVANFRWGNERHEDRSRLPRGAP